MWHSTHWKSIDRTEKEVRLLRCRENCEAVSAKPDELHTKFIAWLERLAPDFDSLAGIKATIRKIWEQRQGDAEELRSILNRKLTQVESRKKTLVDRWVDGKVDDATYSETAGRYAGEIEVIRCELRGTELEGLELEKVLDFADRIILRPARLWVESSTEQKSRLLKTLFPAGIDFNGEEFGTASTPLFFRLVKPDLDDDYGLASPTGFEPVLSP